MGIKKIYLEWISELRDTCSMFGLWQMA